MVSLCFLLFSYFVCECWVPNNSDPHVAKHMPTISRQKVPTNARQIVLTNFRKRAIQCLKIFKILQSSLVDSTSNFPKNKTKRLQDYDLEGYMIIPYLINFNHPYRKPTTQHAFHHYYSILQNMFSGKQHFQIGHRKTSNRIIKSNPWKWQT